MSELVVIGTVSFGACLAAYLGLSLPLLRRLPRTRPAQLLGAAALGSVVWSGVYLTAFHYQATVPAYAGELAETLRTAGWLFFMAHVIGVNRRSGWPRALRYAVVVVVAGAFAAALFDAAAKPDMRLTVGVGAAFVYASFPLILVGLLLIEQFYRGLASAQRWAMKHLCLGLGLLFAFDLYLYTDALLFGAIEPQLWLARGIVNAIAVPLVAVTVARNRNWDADVFVSRHVAFHSTTFLLAGAYLVVMAAGGYYIRDFGGSWGGFFQILFMVVAIVFLAVLMGSSDVRARLRVFLSKHFFSNKYDYRDEWLALIRRLSDDQDGLAPPERAVQAVAPIFDSRAGAVWLRRDDAMYQLAGLWGMEVPADADLHSGDSLVRFLDEKRWILEVPEYHAYPERYPGVGLPTWFGSLHRPWVIVPLPHGEELLGLMLIQQANVPQEITWEDRDLLKTLGNQIAIYLSQYENARALSEARQFEAFNRLTAFLMHDLKNLIAQQSLVVKNAETHKDNPEFVDDAMMTIGNSVKRMEHLLEQLQRGGDAGEVERLNLVEALELVRQRCGQYAPCPEIRCEVDEAWVAVDRRGLTMVMNHIVRNAQEATGPNGHVTIVISGVEEDRVQVDVVDDGPGMDARFIRERLFKPFDSTKATKGMGIGAHQAREFVRSAGGSVAVMSAVGEGTRFRITLPLTVGAAGPESNQATMVGNR